MRCDVAAKIFHSLFSSVELSASRPVRKLKPAQLGGTAIIEVQEATEPRSTLDRAIFVHRTGIWIDEFARSFRELEDSDLGGDLGLEEKLSAMEAAMASLDGDGVFGRGEARRGIIVAVEVMPPDPSNTERVLRLNPSSTILDRWLEDTAEPVVSENSNEVNQAAPR